jgi:hypothetical protein
MRPSKKARFRLTRIDRRGIYGKNKINEKSRIPG